jgi:hypothetical protein
MNRLEKKSGRLLHLTYNTVFLEKQIQVGINFVLVVNAVVSNNLVHNSWRDDYQ